MAEVDEEEAGRPIYRECRACLKIGDSSGYVDIFLETDPPWSWSKDTTVAEELTRIANVQISNADKCSDVICFSCCLKLNNASRFVAMVQKSDQVLKGRPHNQKTVVNNWPKPIQLETEVNEVILGNSMDVEIKQEVLSEEENEAPDRIDSSDKPELDMQIKIEPEEIIQSTPIQVIVNGTITMDQMKEMPNGCEIYYDEEYLNEYIKEEPISDEESGTFDLSLDCMLCAKKLLSVSGLKAHVLAYHSYKSVRRKTGADSSPAKPKQRHGCSTCRRWFWTRTDLMVHETCHNKFHCYGCRMKFDSFRALLEHRQHCLESDTQKQQVKTLQDATRCMTRRLRAQRRRKRTIFKRACSSVQEYLVRPVPTKVSIRKDCGSLIACSKCDEKFTDQYYMNVHNEVHHSSTKTESDKSDNDKVLCKRRKENQDVEPQEKESNEMDCESIELDMQKKHTGTDRDSSNNDCKENIQNIKLSQDKETANKQKGTDKSLNGDKESDKIKEILIEVNVRKNVSDSKNTEDMIESTNTTKNIKNEVEIMDD